MFMVLERTTLSEFRVSCRYLRQGEAMQSMQTRSDGPEVRLPVMVAAELQDSLLVVMHDLHRLRVCSTTPPTICWSGLEKRTNL